MHNFSGGLNPNFKAGMPEENFYEPKAGHMVEARVTAFDPLFWAHHSNVDRLWAKWQELHPNVNPQALDSPLPPFALSVRDTLSTSGLGYEYMQDAHYFPTDNTLSIKRFRSEAVPVSDVALIHRRAEVRLHDVQVTQHAASIRVFLNQPDATADTSMDGNPHFVGQFTTFTGLCYGGPGHCAVPPRRPRVFDHRMRHHKTPNNVRFDATHAVRALLNKHDGQSPQPFSIDITVVVTDLEGRPNDDLLKLDGVSLSFIH